MGMDFNNVRALHAPTAYVYGNQQWRKACLKAVFRLIVGTCVWYFWANIVFHFVNDVTGVCSSVKTNVPNFNITSMGECRKLPTKHIWKGFDISGHCFLLSLVILMQSSETQIQRHWDQIPAAANSLLTVGSKSKAVIKHKYMITRLFVDVLFVVNCSLGLLWHLMLIATCLYFHTFIDKALGASAAIISWMLTYNSWFKSINCSPGCGIFSCLWKYNGNKGT